MEYLAGNLEIENNPIELDIWDKIYTKIDARDGILGYKIPSLGFTDKDDIPTFILRGPEFGIILVDVVAEKILSFDEDEEYWYTDKGDPIFSRDIILSQYELELINRLQKNKDLYDLRDKTWKVDFPIKKYILFHDNTEEEIKGYNNTTTYRLTNEFIASDTLGEIFNIILAEASEDIDPKNVDILDSILDGSDVFSKTKKKKINPSPVLISDYIKKSLDFTFKLDRIQRQVALQVPPGPQRIRGLAGTGKTVILCMKAALAHKAFPDLKILFVFNTQSMYNMIRNTITEYYFNEARRMPNWDNLLIYHAWGGVGKKGLYSRTAGAIGFKPKTYIDVKGKENPLEEIYADLLSHSKSKIKPEYDIVLVDEAQDFSPAFFETIFYLTKTLDGDIHKKRIIWAYDEFQSLTELKITQPEELFGKSTSELPNLPNNVLEGKYKGNIEKDFVLPKSYRNPRINLMVAHGLALGLYSKDGKVPMDDSRDWEARGYIIQKPPKSKFSEGDVVEVERPEENSKNILERLLIETNQDEKTLVVVKNCNDNLGQLNQVVSNIRSLIVNEKVEPEEILVINLDLKNAKSQYEFIRQQLDMINIKSITPGYIEATDTFNEKGYVTLSTTFRAKGNEANIVFILNAQKVIEDLSYKMRNAVFVSITRSRGWVYVYGFGNRFSDLEAEIESIKRDYPRFNFTFPTKEEIRRKITLINSKSDIEKADKEIDTLLADEAYRALLIERLTKDADMMNAIKKQKDNE